MMDIFDDAKSILSNRKRAYDLTFGRDDENVKIVLSDLADFCRADKPTFDSDPRIHALLEGRREVWLRIQKYLNLSPEEIWELSQRKV